jgi:hypothetical protein
MTSRCGWTAAVLAAATAILAAQSGRAQDPPPKVAVQAKQLCESMKSQADSARTSYNTTTTKVNALYDYVAGHHSEVAEFLSPEEAADIETYYAIYTGARINALDAAEDSDTEYEYGTNLQTAADANYAAGAYYLSVGQHNTAAGHFDSSAAFAAEAEAYLWDAWFALAEIEKILEVYDGDPAG